ncbi:MAG: hypothetical protein ABFS46_13985 [Myxococcota bacterium]
MRAHQVFAAMSPERAAALMGRLREDAPLAFAQALAVASASMRARPIYLARRPLEKQAEAARRAFSRVSAADAAEQILAAYFLECRRPLLEEWLDAVGLEHENGVLEQDEPPPPAANLLGKAVAAFREGEDPEEREILLRAFAAQSAVDWPDLDHLLET